MSGSNAGKPADTTAQLIRDMERRLKALEQKTVVRAGDWVIHSVGGVLTATGPNGQSVPLSQPTTTIVEQTLDILEDDDTT